MTDNVRPCGTCGLPGSSGFHPGEERAFAQADSTAIILTEATSGRIEVSKHQAALGSREGRSNHMERWGLASHWLDYYSDVTAPPIDTFILKFSGRMCQRDLVVHAESASHSGGIIRIEGRASVQNSTNLLKIVVSGVPCSWREQFRYELSA